MAPGPVALSDRVLGALASPMIHHRTPQFESELKTCLELLPWFFQTQQPVMMLPSTGSGAMEAALTNTLSPGDKVVSIVSGKFGERWAQMARGFGFHVIELQVPWGETIDLQILNNLLQQHKDLKALLSQACETSTATLHPVQEISQCLRKHSKDALLMIDAITAIGCTQLPMDAWDLDVVVAGSQKVFGLPTGLGFVALSERAWQASRTARAPQFYYDLKKELAANSKHQTRFSSPVSLIRALKVALEDFREMGLDALQKLAEARSKSVREGVEALGFSIFSQSPSPSVTAICVPNYLPGKQWRSLIESKYNLTLMGGQDQLEGKILRIGHMGALQVEDHFALIEALMLSHNQLVQELDQENLSLLTDHQLSKGLEAVGSVFQHYGLIGAK